MMEVNTVVWSKLISGHRVMKLDSMLDNLCPYSLEDYLIFSIYDPFELCWISAGVMADLKNIGFFENRKIAIKTTHIFEESWLATKIMRYIFTNNTYVFTCKNLPTSATGILPFQKDAVLEMIEICKQLRLCCTIYSPIKLDGFERINLNSEPENYNEEMHKPHHLKIYDSKFYQPSKLKVFQDWYCMCSKYELTDITVAMNSIKWTKALLQWSWLKFLLPLAADFNVTNVNELVVELIRNLEAKLKVSVSLKLILNGLKCFPVQLAGTTNLLIYGKKLTGNEIPFRNFKYIFNNSIIQWIHARITTEEELLTSYSYENDWIVNDLQRNILQTFMYVKYDELLAANFPMNLRSIWNDHKLEILKRDKKIDVRKKEWLPTVLRMMDEVS